MNNTGIGRPGVFSAIEDCLRRPVAVSTHTLPGVSFRVVNISGLHHRPINMDLKFMYSVSVLTRQKVQHHHPLQKEIID